MPLKVCAVTGSRADWSLLTVPLALMRDDEAFDLQLVATGQHLVPGSGDTLQAIKAEGFRVAAEVDMLLAADTPAAIAKSMGLALIGFADLLEQLQPDLLLVLGDRYEILPPVQAALVARVPVAHLCGGDVTEGAIDDAIRHAITKMAHLHFVTNAEARDRLFGMGEDPARVHLTGSPGLDRLRLTVPMERDAFFTAVGLEPHPRTLLVTFHPVTLEMDSERQCVEMLAALDALGPEVGLIFTGSNADPGGQAIDRMITAFTVGPRNACFHPSLGSERYANALRHVDAVVGNSSSGLYEAPGFGIPTINIGNRQKGRLRAHSVIDCPPERTAIRTAIERGLAGDWRGTVNPYGDGFAAERIVAVLKALDDPPTLLRKTFGGGVYA